MVESGSSDKYIVPVFRSQTYIQIERTLFPLAGYTRPQPP